MRFHDIRYFLAVCETGNFSRAAKYCGVTQPSVSGAIKQLEVTLGGPLFVRVHGRVDQEHSQVQLTKLGAAVLPYLKQIDQGVRDAARKAAEINADISEVSTVQKGISYHSMPQLNAQCVQIASNALTEVMAKVPFECKTPGIMAFFFYLILDAAAHGLSGKEELVAIAIEQMKAISALFV
jgi:molybdenum-dependent DNA-binding transcriptional regulator ModE